MIEACKQCRYAIWLRLKDLSNWITHPCHTYTRCLSTFYCCGYAYIWMHPSTLAIANIDPQYCRVDWILRWRWRRANNYTTLNDWGCKTFQTGSHFHVIHIQGVWAPSAVVDRHMNAPTHNWLYDWGCKTFQTGSHIHFIHVHVHGVWAPSAVVDRNMDATLTIADIHPQCCRVVWKLMSWRRANNATTLYDWGCKSYHTGSHIHVIHIQGVWVPSAVVDWHMNAPTHPCHSRCSSPM